MRSLEKINNRLRQYGIHAATLQLSRATFRRIYEVNRLIIFVIPKFSGFTYHDPIISPLTLQRIERAFIAGELDEKQTRLLSGFIAEGCKGVCAEVNGKLAGYAWVQLEGEYSFGRTGHMTIPPRHAIVKYLFVSPEFRGMKLGQKLNAARLALVPAGVTPVGFIIPENRYAIRNWEQYGFRRIIEVKRWHWWGGELWHMNFRTFYDCPEADMILEALRGSSHD